MSLRKGKVKSMLESSMDSALLAVEVYNKPRAPFKNANFIVLMIIAWTRLFHAYFHKEIGEKYFYKKSNKRFEKVDGEKKAWELSKCIKEYGGLSEAVEANLKMFIRLRNKIEHREISDAEIGVMIFGECQSLLYNYEKLLVQFFGQEYALNENLAYSLQFSTLRDAGQIEANRKLLSNEVRDIKNFIYKYREKLDAKVYNSQEFSVKLILVPRISNTSRNDLAIEFVKISDLSEADKEKYKKVVALIKDKVVRVEALNPSRLKPKDAIEKINEKLPEDKALNQYDHKCILSILKIRPYKNFGAADDPYATNPQYCHYDETHKDYLYQEAWVDLVVYLINTEKLDRALWREKFAAKEVLDIENL